MLEEDCRKKMDESWTFQKHEHEGGPKRRCKRIHQCCKRIHHCCKRIHRCLKYRYQSMPRFVVRGTILRLVSGVGLKDKERV